MADVVEIVLALKNARQVVTDLKQVTTGVKDVGDTTEETGKKAKIGWKGVAQWAGGAAVIYGATKFVKGAVSATEDLARSTIALQRSTNLDTESASEWAALTKERGISASQFQRSLVTLSKQMDKARTGTDAEASTIAKLRDQIDQVSAAGGRKAPGQIAKLSKAIATAQGQGEKARKTLASLGVTQADLAKGNTEDVLNKVATAMQNMTDHAQRTALAQTLFGRSGQSLVPILSQGAAGVKKLLDEQKAAGNYLSGKSINDTKKLIEQQRELDREYAGVKVQLGTALLPIMVTFGKVIVAITKFLDPLVKHTKLFTAAIVGLAVAFAAYKIAMVAAAIATGVFDVAAAPVVLTVLAIAVAIAALIVVGYDLYKNWGTIKRLAGDVWQYVQMLAGKVVDAFKSALDWAKRNWPLLLGILTGPFGLAVVEIVQHFDAIKAYALKVIGAIKQAIADLVQSVTSIPSKIAGAAKHVPGVKQIAGFFANGGTATTSGSFVVGERGPELVSLPRGAMVQPIAVGGQGTPAPAMGAGLPPLEIVIPLVVDGRELARATARVTADKLARR